MKEATEPTEPTAEAAAERAEATTEARRAATTTGRLAATEGLQARVGRRATFATSRDTSPPSARPTHRHHRAAQHLPTRRPTRLLQVAMRPTLHVATLVVADGAGRAVHALATLPVVAVAAAAAGAGREAGAGVAAGRRAESTAT